MNYDVCSSSNGRSAQCCLNTTYCEASYDTANSVCASNIYYNDNLKDFSCPMSAECTNASAYLITPNINGTNVTLRQLTSTLTTTILCKHVIQFPDGSKPGDAISIRVDSTNGTGYLLRSSQGFIDYSAGSLLSDLSFAGTTYRLAYPEKGYLYYSGPRNTINYQLTVKFDVPVPINNTNTTNGTTGGNTTTNGTTGGNTTTNNTNGNQTTNNTDNGN